MWSKLLAAFLDMLYPRRCPICDQIVMPKGQFICKGCFGKLSFIRQPVCKKCGKEVLSDTIEYCLDCTRHKRSFEYGIALLHYEKWAKHSMAQIKYKNKRQYMDFYIEAISRRHKSQILQMNADVLIPVPIHPSRRRQRGFNQAELLAVGLGRKLGIPVSANMLIRNKNTVPQKQLNPGERLKNLGQAFEMGQKPSGIEAVILVDDIYTTGSTIEACTRMLKQMGVKRVYFISICIGGEQ